MDAGLAKLKLFPWFLSCVFDTFIPHGLLRIGFRKKKVKTKNGLVNLMYRKSTSTTSEKYRNSNICFTIFLTPSEVEFAYFIKLWLFYRVEINLKFSEELLWVIDFQMLWSEVWKFKNRIHIIACWIIIALCGSMSCFDCRVDVLDFKKPPPPCSCSEHLQSLLG